MKVRHNNRGVYGYCATRALSQNEDEHASAAAADNNYDEEDSLKVVPLPAAHVHTSDCCLLLFLFGV